MKRLFIYKGLELEANINGYATYELLCCAQHNSSRDERERILYKNFVQVGEDVKEMIQEIQKYKVK